MTAPEAREVGERVAAASSRVFAAYWLAELAKLEEQVLDPAARWEILRQALQGVAAPKGQG